MGCFCAITDILTFFCQPLQPCVIADCGEHKDDDSWGTALNDNSGDIHPDFPEDSDIDFKDVSVSKDFDLQGGVNFSREHETARQTAENKPAPKLCDANERY